MKTFYRALEDSAYAGDDVRRTDVGVYVGFASNPGQDFTQYIGDVDPSLGQVALTGNLPCMLANRISHFMDFKGIFTINDPPDWLTTTS